MKLVFLIRFSFHIELTIEFVFCNDFLVNISLEPIKHAQYKRVVAAETNQIFLVAVWLR